MIEMNNVCLSGILTKKRIMKRPNGTIQYVLFDLHTNEYNPQSHNYEKMVFIASQIMNLLVNWQKQASMAMNPFEKEIC